MKRLTKEQAEVAVTLLEPESVHSNVDDDGRLVCTVARFDGQEICYAGSEGGWYGTVHFEDVTSQDEHRAHTALDRLFWRLNQLRQPEDDR